MFPGRKRATIPGEDGRKEREKEYAGGEAESENKWVESAEEVEVYNYTFQEGREDWISVWTIVAFGQNVRNIEFQLRSLRYTREE